MNKVRTGFVAGVTALLVIIGIGSASATPLAPSPYDMSVELFELRKRLGSVGFAAVCVARVKAARTPWVAVVIAGVCFEIAHFLQRHQHWPVTDCLRVEGACHCSR